MGFLCLRGALLCSRWHPGTKTHPPGLSLLLLLSFSCRLFRQYGGHRCRGVANFVPGPCFLNGWYYPKPALQRALLPVLRSMDGKRAVAAIHFRLGFVDWAQRVPALALLPRTALTVDEVRCSA